MWSFSWIKVCTNKKSFEILYTPYTQDKQKSFLQSRSEKRGWCGKNESFFTCQNLWSHFQVLYCSSSNQRIRGAATRWPKTWKSKNEFCTLHQELCQNLVVRSVRIQNFLGWQNCGKHSGFQVKMRVIPTLVTFMYIKLGPLLSLRGWSTNQVPCWQPCNSICAKPVSVVVPITNSVQSAHNIPLRYATPIVNEVRATHRSSSASAT